MRDTYVVPVSQQHIAFVVGPARDHRFARRPAGRQRLPNHQPQLHAAGRHDRHHRRPSKGAPLSLNGLVFACFLDFSTPMRLFVLVLVDLALLPWRLVLEPAHRDAAE